MALAAILLDPDPPPLVVIEEPELGLHPDVVTLGIGRDADPGIGADTTGGDYALPSAYRCPVR